MSPPLPETRSWFPRLETPAAGPISTHLPDPRRRSERKHRLVKAPFLPPLIQEISDSYMAVCVISRPYFSHYSPHFFSFFFQPPFGPQSVQKTVISGGVSGPPSSPGLPEVLGADACPLCSSPSAAGKHSTLHSCNLRLLRGVAVSQQTWRTRPLMISRWSAAA